MPDTLTIVTVLVAVSAGELRSYKANGKPAMRPVIAGFLLGILLYILGEISPALAKPFAVLVILSVTVVNGSAIADLFNSPKKVTKK